MFCLVLKKMAGPTGKSEDFIFASQYNEKANNVWLLNMIEKTGK